MENMHIDIDVALVRFCLDLYIMVLWVVLEEKQTGFPYGIAMLL